MSGEAAKTMTDTVQIVVTPGSGDGRARSTARRLQKALARRGYETRTQTFADLDRLLDWSATCTPEFSHLVGVGGDATLSAAASAAVRLSIPFVPVPCGFGNMFARAFGFRGETRRVIELFERGQIRRVDVGAVNGDHIFLSHRSYGLLEEVQEAVERGRAQPRSRLMRHLAYYMMGERFLVSIPLTAVRVEVEGAVLAEDAAVVTVANVETYRGFLSLTPTASPIDGFFDVFVIPGGSKWSVWTRIFKLLLHMPGRWEGVILCHGRSVRVTVDGRTDELTLQRRVLPLLVLPESMETLKVRQTEAEESGAPAAVAASAVPFVSEPRGAGLRRRR
jgi:diacylglycerol kinase (ATP)